MPITPLVTAITPEHIEGFRRAVDEVARERRYLAFLEAPPLPETRDFVLRSIRNGDPHFVAIVSSVVIGWCDIGRHGRPAHAHRGTLGMGIVPAHRGAGLGSRLIMAALDQARVAGFTRVELDVHADNAPAIGLYEKVGFLKEGTMRDAVLVDGRYRDAIKMALLLHAPS